MSYLVDANKNSVNVAASNATYTLTATDEIYLALDGQTVKLPNPTTATGRTYTIKLNGNFTSGVLITSLDGNTTYYTINKDYGSVNIVSNGANWVVLADAIQVSQIATTTYVTEATWSHQGTWSNSTSYVAKDVVVYQGSSWLALQASLNSAPAEGADWTLIVAKGDTGATGDTGAPGADGATGAPGTNGADAVWYFQGAWDSNYNGGLGYIVGDIVTYNGETWYSLVNNNSNSTPTDVNTDWTKLASKGSQSSVGRANYTTESTFPLNLAVVDYTNIIKRKYYLDNGASSVTVNLPAVADCDGLEIVFKKLGSGTITVDANGSETIDGALTLTMSQQYSSVTLTATSSGWYIE